MSIGFPRKVFNISDQQGVAVKAIGRNHTLPLEKMSFRRGTVPSVAWGLEKGHSFCNECNVKQSSHIGNWCERFPKN